MYHELSEQQARNRIRRRIGVVIVVILLVLAGWFASAQIGASLREQGAMSVRNAILNGAKQCCAIEGSYPSSLDYLEKNYGLVINHDDYAVTYSVFAGNVMPNVVVLAK